MDIKLYTIGCPACNVLEKKLVAKSISFTSVTDVKTHSQLGITAFPVLQIDGGPLMTFAEAVQWVNKQEAK